MVDVRFRALEFIGVGRSHPQEFAIFCTVFGLKQWRVVIIRSREVCYKDCRISGIDVYVRYASENSGFRTYSEIADDATNLKFNLHLKCTYIDFLKKLIKIKGGSTEKIDLFERW